MAKWLLFLFPFSLFSLYVGNPADPSLMNTGFFSTTYPVFKFTSGYILDYISDKCYASNSDSPELRHFGLHSQMASFSLIFLERLQLNAATGGTKEHVSVPPTLTNMATTFLDFHSAHHFSWEAGAKAVFLQWGQTYFSCDFSYFAIPASHKAYFKFLNRLDLPLEPDKQKFYLREWQFSMGLSSRFWFLTPYGGASYLHSRLHIQEGEQVPSLRYHNDVNWGFFYGLTLSLSGRFHLNVERRVRDEYAYTFSSIAVF